MASTPVEIQYQSGLTLTLELYPLGSDTIANGSGDSLTEATNRKGFYVATVTESLSGWHHVVVKEGSTAVANGYIYLTDTTDVHRTEAPPWSQLEGRVTVDVDLVDAPNATAVAAIQSGLATASALSTTDGKIDGIKAVTDALPDAGALTSLATATALQTVDDNVDAIKAVTDNLPDSGALSSLATASALATVDNVVDAILEDTGTTLPSSLAGIEAKVDTVDSVADGIKAVTDKLDDLIEDASGYRFTEKALEEAPSGGSGGATAQEVWEYETRTLTSLDEDGTSIDLDNTIQTAAAAALTAYDPPTKAELDSAVSPLATSVELAAVDAKIDTVDGIADAILAAVGTDGVAISSATMQAIADALLDRANAIDGATPRAALRYIAAVLAGKVSGAGTGIEKFLGLDGTTERVRVTVDDEGNRSAVEYDPA